MGHGGVNGARDDVGCDKRPRRIVNHDDAGPRKDPRERVSHRVLPARTARDKRQRLTGTAGPSRGRGVEMILWHRHDDLVDPIARDERVDAEIKNRAAREFKKLLGPIGAKPNASPTGGNNGGYVH